MKGKTQPILPKNMVRNKGLYSVQKGEGTQVQEIRNQVTLTKKCIGVLGCGVMVAEAAEKVSLLAVSLPGC